MSDTHVVIPMPSPSLRAKNYHQLTGSEFLMPDDFLRPEILPALMLSVPHRSSRKPLLVPVMWSRLNSTAEFEPRQTLLYHLLAMAQG